jgi:hypothetical protein
MRRPPPDAVRFPIMELRRRRQRWIVAGALVVTSIVSFDPSTPVVTAATAASVSCAPALAGAAPTVEPLASFTPQEPPQRLIDTRDGIGGFTGLVGAGCTLRIDAALTGVPADARALALSVTAIAAGRGYLTVYPCASGQPPTSNVNARPLGTPTPNLAIALLDVDRTVCIYSQNPAHLVVDMTGWWTTDGPTRFRSISPTRVEDTRLDTGRTPAPPETPHEIDLSAVVPAGTTAVVANLTVTEPTGPGHLAAFPCGVTPRSSNLNFRPGESRAVAITVGISSGLRLCTQSNVAHHVVVDLMGFYEPTPQFGPAASLTPVPGTRLADSRTPDGPWTSAFGAGTVRSLRPTEGRADSPQATAVVVNTVATNATGPGFVSIYPCDTDVPSTSVVNFDVGEEATNLAFVDLSTAGEICFYTSTGVDVVVDLFGVMVAPPGMLTEHLRFDAHTWPPFSPAATDYAVECGDAPVDLELDPLVGTSMRVNNVPVAAGTLRLPGNDDRLTTVTLQRGNTVQNFWFRCVPADFPRLAVARPGAPTPGWYLTAASTVSSGSFALILDEYGAPVWYKRLDRVGTDLKRRTDGRIVWAPNLGPRYGVEPDAGYRAISLFGTLVGEYISFDEGGVEHPTDHHDFAELPGGRYALISYPVVDGVDLTALPGSGWLADDSIADNVIQEFDADGALAWSWTLSDHFGYDEVPYPVRWPPLPGYDGGEVDVWHVNGLSAIADGSGDYLVTARHLDAAFRIDRATKAIDWILGSLPIGAPQKSGAPRLQILNDPLGGPRRPHHAQLTGNVLTLFDNRTDTGQPSRAVAYRIDAAAKTATLLWSIQAPGGETAFGLGSVELTGDGSTVVGWGPVQPMIQEFDAARRLLMEIRQVPGGAIYRVDKEPKSAWSVNQLRLAAGGTAEAP